MQFKTCAFCLVVTELSRKIDLLLFWENHVNIQLPIFVQLTLVEGARVVL